jgi:hypothetical protein
MKYISMILHKAIYIGIITSPISKHNPKWKPASISLFNLIMQKVSRSIHNPIIFFSIKCNNSITCHFTKTYIEETSVIKYVME